MQNPTVIVVRAAQATPPSVAVRMRGLSDRAIAWLFVGPTMLLLSFTKPSA